MHRVRLALTAAALSGAALTTSATAQDDGLLAVADTPAWALGRQFVQVFNEAEPNRLERFLAQHLSDTARADQAIRERAAELLQARAALGPVETVEISGVPQVLVLNVRGREARHADIVLVAGEAPRPLEALRIIEVPSETASR